MQEKVRTILLFGAGKSATALIDYLLANALKQNWKLVVVDSDKRLAVEKMKDAERGSILSFDVTDEKNRLSAIQDADIVLSLLPPALHYLLAKDCLRLRKNLLTASYVDEQMESLREEIEKNDLLFLCEMGLDPGIDHMSAKKMIDEIKEDGGMITSFVSHCGGLVAPESDDNPWHYKISWNPRNVVNAGKDGALFKEDGLVQSLSYKEIFKEKRLVHISREDILCWYPNRDSLKYIERYGLKDCPTFIRTTLRHPDFMYGWNNLVELKLTDETLFYDTEDKTLMDFFKEHMERNHFSEWLEEKLHRQLEETQGLLNNLVNLVEMEENPGEDEPAEDFMMVNKKGDLQQVDMDDLKNNAAATIAFKMHESKLTLRQLFFLGMDDGKTLINKGRCSAAGVLQFALETKLALKETDKDMVVMLHEIEYEQRGKKQKKESLLSVVGKDSVHTAMAKTVGLPLGIAAKGILNKDIRLKGLHIPLEQEIYTYVLRELEDAGIQFKEETKFL
jgi:saccharopine dehydrogenase-like NADP-dependent oxidoreductase